MQFVIYLGGQGATHCRAKSILPQKMDLDEPFYATKNNFADCA